MTDVSPNADPSGTSRSSARAAFAAEGLPFPPIPHTMARALTAQGPGWYATQLMNSAPYELEHYVTEAEGRPDAPDYAVVGFDGYGINSFAVHCYLVRTSLALFIQLPWGGVYADAKSARQEIISMFDWTAKLQLLLDQAEAAGTIPAGVRLEVIASRFRRAGWRWIGGDRSANSTPWNSAAGMRDVILEEVRVLAAGRAFSAHLI